MTQTPFFPYGRQPDIAKLKATLTTLPRPYLLRGPSGIGKTEVIHALLAELRHEAELFTLSHTIASPAHDLNHVVDDLTRQLLSSSLLPRIDPRDIAEKVVQVAKDSTWAIATAMLLNLADRILPGAQQVATNIANGVSDELAKVFPSSMIERLQQNVTQDLLVGFLNILAALNDLGLSGVILLDQAESSSDAVREAILGMAIQIPDKWSILMTVNDEIPEGIDLLDKLWPRLAYAQAIQITLRPLDVNALEKWCVQERGATPSLMELESIISNCQGRPLLLREWVHGASTEAEIDNIWQRLGPYYQRRLSALSPPARTLIRTLALLPEQSVFSLSMIARLSHSPSHTQAFELVEELMNSQFVDSTPHQDSYRFVHDITRRQVLAVTPQAVMKESAEELLDALRPIRQQQAEPQRLYALAILEYIAEKYDDFLKDALPVATRLLASGSYAPALELYKACISLDTGKLPATAEFEARLGMSAVLYSTGYYREGLEVIKGSEAWPNLAGARGLLAQGRLMLRLSRFRDAHDYFDRARQRFLVASNTEGVLQCDKENVTVLRDLGMYEEAVRKAEIVLAGAKEHNVSTDTLASCYRAVARSLAFTGPLDQAISAADEALSIAHEVGSASDAGNARLANAEAYRLAGQPSDAIDNYKAAAETALTLGNRDSYLWSMLGLSDCYFMLGEISAAAQMLTPVSDTVKFASDRYPLVYLHWKLSDLSIAQRTGEDVGNEFQLVIQAYKALGVAWPERYVSRLAIDATPLPKLFG